MTQRDALTEHLLAGDLVIEGRLLDSSNAAMLATCTGGDVSMRVVYKPRRGERPLWDFPSGTLGHREVAMSTLDAALGWDLVPATVWRDAAPLGPGSVQVWVDVDEESPPVDVVDARSVPAGWHTVAEGEGARGDHVCLVHEESQDLRRMAVLDAVANNADRKGGHVLRRRDGGVAGIDHGLTFHADNKLRTVLWGWAGTPIPDTTCAALEELDRDWQALAARFHGLLSAGEIEATRERLRAVVAIGRYPEPLGAWPALPWPAM